MKPEKKPGTTSPDQTSIPQKTDNIPLGERPYLAALNAKLNTSRAGQSFVASMPKPQGEIKPAADTDSSNKQ
jgi:hypothetical protein